MQTRLSITIAIALIIVAVVITNYSFAETTSVQLKRIKFNATSSSSSSSSGSLSATASVSITGSLGHEVQYGSDGNETTYYANEGPGCPEYKLDLGSVMSVSRVRILVLANSSGGLFYSTNNSIWTALHLWNASTSQQDIDVNASISARYIKARVGNVRTSGYRIYEIQAYADSGSGSAANGQTLPLFCGIRPPDQ